MNNFKINHAERNVFIAIGPNLLARMFREKAGPTGLLLILLMHLVLASQTFAAHGSLLEVQTSKPGAVVTIEREISDDKVLLTVSDSENNPLFGLTKEDFIITASGRTARILSTQPMEENLSVPRNIVMVLDNSDSMRQRNAIGPLLAGVDELLKIVRPIDQVEVVVFSNKKKMSMGGRDLRVSTFRSNKPAELKNFITNIYRDDITSSTVLFEGMLAGLDIMRSMPENEPRFMVVFSDGEDLSSAYSENLVIKIAKELAAFNAYAIDYMPTSSTDRFLKKFAEQNRGQIWKATSDATLVEIFQSVASKMEYYYELSYLFPITGSLSVVPNDLTINELEAVDAALSVERSGGASPAKIASAISRIDASMLTLRPFVDTAYNITRWSVKLVNTAGVIIEKEGDGTPPNEIEIPLNTISPGKLAAGGDITVDMEVFDTKGQDLKLITPTIKINHFKTTGKLSVAPSTLNINELESLQAQLQADGTEGADQAKDASIVRKIDSSALKLRPIVDTSYNFTRWNVKLTNTGGTLVEKEGEGAPPEEIDIPLEVNLLEKLAGGGDIKAGMELYDATGQSLKLNAPNVKVNNFKTKGSLLVAPAEITIEEIKTIDSSPLLGHIYFRKGSSDIAAPYVLLDTPEEISSFDEQRFRGTLEKYYQVLNIIGKRMNNRSAAKITLTGCNDNTGKEENNKKLSSARAEAVKKYFQTVWEIAPERLWTEVRNLPEIPSTSRIEEGQAENRRVEISTNDSAILAPIRSTYLSVKIDKEALTLNPKVVAAHGIAHWTLRATNKNGSLGKISGNGTPAEELRVSLKTFDPAELAAGGDISLKMVLEDNTGQELNLTAGPIKVNFIKTSQRMALKQDLTVQEKYALILFNFDSDTISSRNQEIVNTIVSRMRELPQVTTEIVGHTDNIGKEDYNIKLSQRRALSVYNVLTSAYGSGLGDNLRHSGVGPNDPLFDNATPESRAFNRTVTITLEYMSGE